MSYRRHLLLVVFLWVLILLRDPLGTLLPPLFNEDGSLLFAHYYPNNADLFIRYSGYISVGPNILGYLCHYLPTRWVAHAYLGLAALSTAIAFAMFALPRFRSVLASDSQRILICAVLALLPIGNAVVTRTLTWLFWSWLLGSALLCTVRPPAGSKGLWLEGAYLGINAVSSPVSIVLLPFLGWRAYAARGRAERILFAALCLVTVAYLFTVDRGKAGASLGYTAWHSAVAFVDRVLFEGIWTNWIRIRFVWRGYYWLVVTIGALTGTCAVGLAVRVPQARAALSRLGGLPWRFLGLWAALTALAIHTRFAPGGLDYSSYFHHRYFWIQQYTFWLLGLTVVLQAMPLETAARSTRICLTTVLAGYLVVANYLDRQEYAFLHADGRPTRDFLQVLAACEKSGSCESPVRLDKSDAEWTIAVSPRL